MLWAFFLFSFLSVWALGSVEPVYSGIKVALQVLPVLGLFPAFASFGMISDRILTKDLLRASKIDVSEREKLMMSSKIQKNKLLNKEDYVRIILAAILIFLSLPWFAARFGVAQVLFFSAIHLGEHHGYLGAYILLSIILISKTEKLYLDSIFKELSIYFLCFLTLWGGGLFIHDFAYEQLNFHIPFLVWGSGSEFYSSLFLQMSVIALLSFPIYYLAWRKYFKPKIKS